MELDSNKNSSYHLNKFIITKIKIKLIIYNNILNLTLLIWTNKYLKHTPKGTYHYVFTSSPTLLTSHSPTSEISRYLTTANNHLRFAALPCWCWCWFALLSVLILSAYMGRRIISFISFNKSSSVMLSFMLRITCNKLSKWLKQSTN